MARGNQASTGRSARSEAGTIFRADTANSRINSAIALLKNAQSGVDNASPDVSDLSKAIKLYVASNKAITDLADFRPEREAYQITLSGDEALTKAGKLNLLESTIDGKKINYEVRQRGAFDRSGTKSTKSEGAEAGFLQERDEANKENGFIFALDIDKKLYAIPHTWDTNNPQGTVGIFRGDLIENEGEKGTKSLRVIGTFDASPRGLQLAAATAGDDIGRTNGIKQTAEILAGNKWVPENIVAGRKTGSYVFERVVRNMIPEPGKPMDLNATRTANDGKMKVSRIDPASKVNNLIK
jgi:hypothetical protein